MTTLPPEHGPPRELAILGAGGHASVVADAAHRTGRVRPIGCFDDAGPEAMRRRPIPVAMKWLGHVEAARDCAAPLVLGIGHLGERRRVMERLGIPADREATRFAAIIDFSAIVSAFARIAAGAVVLPRAVVNARASVGEHAIINTSATVEHDVVIGRNAHVAPGAVLCGGVTVGADTLIGAGAVVLPGVRVGRGATLGAGSVATGDIADGETMAGSPARAVGAAV